MATPTRLWLNIAILALLSSTLAKPPLEADLDHVVKPPRLAHVVKPPKADLDHVVKPPKADLDHMVKPTKVDLGHVVKPLNANLDHVVKPPKAARKLQVDEKDESSKMGRIPDWEEVEDGLKNRGIFGGGHGGGGATFGFHNIKPFPAFPFTAVVPEVTTWGEGDGYGGSDANSDANSGKGVQCHCSNGYVMHYTMSPINGFRPMDMMKRDGPEDMAPSSSP